MRTLPLDTILPTDEMLSLLLADPRLLHVGERQASAFLDGLFDETLRSDDSTSGYINDAVPVNLYNAWRQGRCQKLFVAAETIACACDKMGIFCAVCGDIDTPHQRCIPDLMTKALAPTICSFTYTENGEDHIWLGMHPVLCSRCFQPFSRRLSTQVLYTGTPEEVEAFVMSRLSGLLSDTAFRSRVSKTGRKWLGLRFDPRRAA